MTNPLGRPGESTVGSARSARRRLKLLAGAFVSAVLIVAISLAAAALSHTGATGFGIAFFGLSVSVLGIVILRELRRTQRLVGRLDLAVAKAKKSQSEADAATGKKLTSGLASLEKHAADQRVLLQSLVVGQREHARLIASAPWIAGMEQQNAIQLRQIQALLNLFAVTQVSAITPSMGGSEAAPDVVSLVVDEVERTRPKLIVECGSGSSTLWLALAVRHHGLDSRIVALDHDATAAATTSAQLRAHGVDHLAEIRLAPLQDPEIDGHSTEWYARSALAGLTDIGVLFVHGPPSELGPQSRYPALPLLHDSLAETATIVLDDAHEPSAREIASRWAIQLPEFAVEEVPVQKGATLFRRQ